MPAAIPIKLVVWSAIHMKLVIWFKPCVTATFGVAVLHGPVVKMAISLFIAFP